MSTCFKVLDINGRPAVNVAVTADYAGTRRQVQTDSAGLAKFAEDIPQDAKVYSIGFATVTRIACQETKEPYVPGPEEHVISTVGLSCDILEKSMFGRSFYRHINRYTGSGSAWDSELSDARQKAYKDTSCNNPPPPPPKTVNDVQKDVDILRGTISALDSRVQDLITSINRLGQGLIDLEARIKAWIQDKILDILIAGLNAQLKREGYG